MWNRSERETYPKSLRNAVLRYGFPAGSHFIFYSPVCIPVRCTGENEDFYILTGKSHPPERNIVSHFPLNFSLLVLFLLLLQ